MSGMKAGLFYNDWPTIGHQWFPDVLTNTHNWNWYNVTHYTENSFMITLVHLLHRTTAYLLLVLVLVFHFVWRKKYYATLPKSYLLLIIISAQVLIGIWTLVSCVGSIPIFQGALHQLMGLLFLSTVVTFIFFSRNVNDRRI